MTVEFEEYKKVSLIFVYDDGTVIKVPDVDGFKTAFEKAEEMIDAETYPRIDSVIVMDAETEQTIAVCYADDEDEDEEEDYFPFEI